MVSRYITVGTLAIFIWEFLINICNDCNLLIEHRLRLPTVVYFISRLCCFGFTIFSVILRFEPITSSSESKCAMLDMLVVIFYCTALIFTSLLFFFRTRAVFNTYPWVVAFFAGLWLAILGGCLGFIIVIVPLNPASNRDPICINSGINPFIAATTIIPLVNDTLVFLAISWRLSLNSHYPETLESGIRLLIFGDYLPAFSKALLQDGQAYYLTVVTMNIISVFMLFYPSNAEILRSIFAVPNVALMNVMASRVFRNTMLFGTQGGTEISTIEFQEI